MIAYLRYALATICFASSLACAGLWWDNLRRPDAIYDLEFCTPLTGTILVRLECRYVAVGALAHAPSDPRISWKSRDLPGFAEAQGQPEKMFGFTPVGVYFPLWYPIVVFGLLGSGVLRLGRRFTLRSVIVATTVTAGLLGMVVAL